ncbi:MAG: sugar transferase [Janthinobacterium lividum]
MSARLPFQVAVVGLTAMLVPLAVQLVIAGVVPTGLAGTRITQFASVIAALSALLAVRRFIAYPGTGGFAYIIPSFSVTFGLAATVLLALRLRYSGSMILTAYVVSTAITFVLWYLGERSAPRRMFFVPHGAISIIEDTPQIEWIALQRPELPDDAGSGIVADLHHDHHPEWERLLADAALSGKPVYHTKQLHESLTGRVQIEHLSENSFGSLLPNRAYRGVKRAADVLACLVAMPLLALPMLVVAALIRLDSPGPSFFLQERMGYRGKTFRVIKFRTMRVAEPGADQVFTSITRDKDDRVTRIGRLLRRTRMDELPQILNVLRGEMSWIGPRPEAMALSRWYEAELPFYSYRHIVRPGISGWAQVNQGHVAELDDAHRKLHYDFYYIKHLSSWLDVLIAMRTCGTILTGYGAR